MLTMKVEPCGCEYSFSGVKGGKSGENIAKALRDPTYPSEDRVALKIMATVFRAEDVWQRNHRATLLLQPKYS